jgi:hypothetical protein
LNIDPFFNIIGSLRLVKLKVIFITFVLSLGGIPNPNNTKSGITSSGIRIK